METTLAAGDSPASGSADLSTAGEPGVAGEDLTKARRALIWNDSFHVWNDRIKVNLFAFRNSDARSLKGITREGFDMLMKIGGLARAIAIVLAVVAAFVALNMMNVPLVLVVLGLVAGLAMPEDRLLLTTVTLIALPIIGAALGNIPNVGAQFGAVCTNLQLAMAGAVATTIAIRLYHLVMDGVMGLTGAAAGGTAATAAR